MCRDTYESVSEVMLDFGLRNERKIIRINP